MDLNTVMNPTERAQAMREAAEVNARLRRPDGTLRGGNLDRNSFLRLLVTELRHQDPTQPMQDREFIAQMAQFSTLEQITSMTTTMQSLQSSFRAHEAFSLLGRRVYYLNPTTGEMESGVVVRINRQEGEYRLMVNNREVGINEIISVQTEEQRIPANSAQPPATQRRSEQ
ncbi:MAG: flagellar hook assembly protein FlgD [Spirochaetes bacterium]|nr:flagellar hook assembly protein FlgD [Spirochaetota bacterium]